MALSVGLLWTRLCLFSLKMLVVVIQKETVDMEIITKTKKNEKNEDRNEEKRNDRKREPYCKLPGVKTMQDRS